MDNQQMGNGMGMGTAGKHIHHKWHWVHRVAEFKAMALSFLSGLAFILAWVATFRGTVLGLIAPHWYWDSLILGILALCAKVVWAKCDKDCSDSKN
ncbi:MAG: hypothetical protein Q8L24_00630 [bacterium]|nr:hypothetical protein [bacterium]